MANVVNLLSRDLDFTSNLTASHISHVRAASARPLPTDLQPDIARVLEARGITGLYSHQWTSWEQVRAGKSIVVVTGTASGKSLCYMLPVLSELARDARARALFLFPTKALAQDQSAVLRQDAANLAQTGLSIGVATYDGDTPQSERALIRSTARIILSNPDMLHAGVLPHHTLWAEFFHTLRFVVLDEIHAYRGVFGSNVANVIRRLKRIARSYGSTPQFIATSATIANPVEFAERLIEEEVVAIDHDGSPRAERQFAVYNPPVVNRSLGIRRGAVVEAARLAEKLLAADVQSIVFARSRRTVELFLKYLSSAPDARAGKVRGYRGGYLPGERREIERGLRDGTIRCVVATNALELGVDIGGMDAALLVGYPGTIASMRQQAGRAGRQDRAALAVMVASADPLDQFLARHPEYMFDRSPEQALIDPDNLLILLQHLRCAAFELAFAAGEAFGRVEGSRVEEFLQVLTEAGSVYKSADKYYWMADQYPADAVSLRSASAESVVLEAEGTTVGTVDLASANWMAHPGAVYLHDGRSYAVEELDLEKKLARMSPVDVDYYTEPRSENRLQLLTVDRSDEIAGTTKHYGEVAVTSRVLGYRKLRWLTRENLGEGEVSLPETELHTTAYWVAPHQTTVEALRTQGVWTNDPNDYGADWERLRGLVRARDDYRCQNCGAREDGRKHDVHHKIPFRTFPTAEMANSMDNLVTLCGNCHGLAEAAVRLRSGLASVAYAVGHLAPLFLMCDQGDLGMDSDPRSPLADARPAIAIYDMAPGGIGLCERLYELHASLMQEARDMVQECGCDSGCPSCVGPGGEDGTGGKREALALLHYLAPEVKGVE